MQHSTRGLEKKFILSLVGSTWTAKWVSWEMDVLAKLGAMTDLPETMNDLQGVDHTFQKHFTMSKQWMLDSLMPEVHQFSLPLSNTGSWTTWALSLH